MPTAWKVRGKSIGGSGPTWDAMATDDTDDYDALTAHKWEWTADWTLFGQNVSTGEYWSEVLYLWADDPTSYKSDPWTMINATKNQESTET